MTSKASPAPTTEKPAAVAAIGPKQPKQETSAPSPAPFLACWESHPSKKNMEKPTAAEAKNPTIPDIKNNSSWEKFLKDSKKTCKLIVINFNTTWSTPCIAANKGIEDLPEKYKDVKFAKVDIDFLLDVTKAFKVRMMPTFVLLKRNIENGDKAKGSKKDSSGNEGSQKGKESGKEGCWKGKKSGKEGSRKDKESGKYKQENAANTEKKSDEEEGNKKSEEKNFMVVAMVEGWKEEELKDEIEKHRYLVIWKEKELKEKELKEKELKDEIEKHRHLVIDNPMA